ncbi:MAG TPA: hypothetical protein VG389_16470 [Myxococcota bacterium]|jgi:cysteine-rich repeat protein|nr:hypothetical protein [Myxococcota bacterium]
MRNDGNRSGNGVLLLATAAALVAAFGGGAGCRAKCGDFTVSGDEQCDGQASCRAPGSPNECRFAVCGDGIAEANEGCDDGDMNDDDTPDACRTDCQPARCADNVLDMGEECDGSCGCSFDCTLLWACGDGMLFSDCEQCDDGAANSDTTPDACRTSCRLPRCGDDVQDTGEACDDGNPDLDGDGLINSDALPDHCRSMCVLPTCGDYVTDTGEECDGQTSCGPTCTLSFCGDGNIDAGEDCDGGLANSDYTPDACRTSCVIPTCGDGVPDPVFNAEMFPEQCDDDNFVTGDGCDALCQWEASCANAALEPTEQCDDGNVATGDGCDASCMFEAGTSCAMAIDLDDPMVATIVDTSHTYADTTIGAFDGFVSDVCVTGAGDRAHKVYLLQNSRVDVTLVASGFQAVLSARRDCLDVGTEIACDATPPMPTLTFLGSAGDTWYIIVDGVTAADTGDYSVIVAVRPTRAAMQDCDLAGVDNVCDPAPLACVNDGTGRGVCM